MCQSSAASFVLNTFGGSGAESVTEMLRCLNWITLKEREEKIPWDKLSSSELKRALEAPHFISKTNHSIQIGTVHI